MKSIVNYLLLLFLCYFSPASAQVIDLSTGIGSSGLIAMGSTDDTWTVCFPGSNPNNSASYMPLYAVFTSGPYVNLDPSVRWLSPKKNSNGSQENCIGGNYYYKMTFENDNECDASSAVFNFSRIGADDKIDQIIVNGHIHSVNYSYSPLSSGITLTIPGSEIITGTNEILLRVFNFSSGGNSTPHGIQINGNLTLTANGMNPNFTLSMSGGVMNATAHGTGTHTWEVYGSPDGAPGSYIYIGTYYTPSISASGYTCYKVKHTIVNPCGNACRIQTTCNAPCNECGPLYEPQNLAFDKNTFSWSPVPGATSYEVEVIFNDPECCPNPSGTVTILKFQTTDNFYQPSEIPGCFSWRVKALCENGSYAISGKKCTPPICGQLPPTNLVFDKTSLPYTFSWSAVTGAVSYELEIIMNDPACCPNSSAPQTVTIPVTGTSYQNPHDMSNCFSWRVKALCANGWSATSSPKCETLGGWGKRADQQTGATQGNNSALAQTVKLFPNPAKGLVTIEIETAKDKTYTIGICDISGKLVKTLEPGKITKGKTTLIWDSTEAAKGTYFIKVITSDKEVITKKLVIE